MQWATTTPRHGTLQETGQSTEMEARRWAVATLLGELELYQAMHAISHLQ